MQLDTSTDFNECSQLKNNQKQYEKMCSTINKVIFALEIIGFVASVTLGAGIVAFSLMQPVGLISLAIATVGGSFCLIHGFFTGRQISKGTQALKDLESFKSNEYFQLKSPSNSEEEQDVFHIEGLDKIIPVDQEITPKMFAETMGDFVKCFIQKSARDKQIVGHMPQALDASAFSMQVDVQNDDVYLIGDLHGKYELFEDHFKNMFDAKFIDKNGNVLPGKKVVFTGDFVNKDEESEYDYQGERTFLAFMRFTMLNPESVFAVRGNHDITSDMHEHFPQFEKEFKDGFSEEFTNLYQLVIQSIPENILLKTTKGIIPVSHGVLEPGYTPTKKDFSIEWIAKYDRLRVIDELKSTNADASRELSSVLEGLDNESALIMSENYRKRHYPHLTAERIDAQNTKDRDIRRLAMLSKRVGSTNNFSIQELQSRTAAFGGSPAFSRNMMTIIAERLTEVIQQEVLFMISAHEHGSIAYQRSLWDAEIAYSYDEKTVVHADRVILRETIEEANKAGNLSSPTLDGQIIRINTAAGNVLAYRIPFAAAILEKGATELSSVAAFIESIEELADDSKEEKGKSIDSTDQLSDTTPLLSNNDEKADLFKSAYMVPDGSSDVPPMNKN